MRQESSRRSLRTQEVSAPHDRYQKMGMGEGKQSKPFPLPDDLSPMTHHPVVSSAQSDMPLRIIRVPISIESGPSGPVGLTETTPNART